MSTIERARRSTSSVRTRSNAAISSPRLLASIAFALLATAALAGPARPSMTLSDTNITQVSLGVNKKGEALVSYVRADGKARHVLLWGALNALPPSSDVPQVQFARDYAGGWGKYRNVGYWKTFANACQPYDGPQLAYFIVGCKAPDGSYWAVQAWQRKLPHRGFPPWLDSQTALSFDVSHWTGDPARVELYDDWAFGGDAEGIFGRLSYDGVPVHGFGTTPRGAPTDHYGRSLYVDTLDSAYGAGWNRETSIVFRNPTGAFCYSFWPTNDVSLPGSPTRPAGVGSSYRINVIGPGVTPDIIATVPALGPSDPQNPDDAALLQSRLQLYDQVTAGDKFCATQR
jgi:hypothetical protein